MKKSCSFLFLFALISIFAYSVSAQVPPPPPPPVVDDEPIVFDSRLVVVPVSVTDAEGRPVTGLTVNDFRILEENKPQEVAEVSDAEKVPLEIALLFDVSGSTDPMFRFQQETAAKFLQDVMRPEDRATILTIGEGGLVVQARGTAAQSAVAVRSLVPTRQQTAFYDSVNLAADYLQKSSPEGRRKVVVVISDGEDNNSKGVLNAIWNVERKVITKNLSREELNDARVKARDDAKIAEQSKVLRSLQNADAVFYAINPAGSSYKLNKISQFGQSNLEKFAVDTGGTAFLPKFLPVDTGDALQNTGNMRRNSETLETIFRQLANELRAQYLVQYYSETDFPANKFVNLDVRLQNPRNYTLRARQGYFAK